jgi:hypothetical protein
MVFQLQFTPLEGREHVTLRAAIPTSHCAVCAYAPPRAVELGFFAKKPRKTPRVSGGSEL